MVPQRPEWVVPVFAIEGHSGRGGVVRECRFGSVSGARLDEKVVRSDLVGRGNDATVADTSPVVS